jgi:hypothetical protein
MYGLTKRKTTMRRDWPSFADSWIFKLKNFFIAYILFYAF